MRFCHDCGAETVGVWYGKYNTDTGKKEMTLECTAKDDCLHAGHNFRPTKSMRFWNRYYPVQCTKCGETATGDSAASD